MTTPLSSRLPSSLGSRLLAGAGTLALLAAVGLLASRPAHTAGGPVPVTVANVPLGVTAADGPARQPFQEVTNYVIRDGHNTGELNVNGGYTDIVVPAGKRLVIQTVCLYRSSGTSVSLTPGQSVRAYLGPTAGGQGGYYALPLVPTDGTPFPGTTQALNVYADPATRLFISAYRTGTKGEETEEVVVSGYLVDLP